MIIVYARESAVQTVYASTTQERLSEEEHKYHELELSKKAMQEFFNEIITQTEVDFEDYSEKIGEKIVQNKLEAEERESKFKVGTWYFSGPQCAPC